MAALSDEDMNMSLMLPLKMLEYPAVIPNFLCKKLKIFVMKIWFVYFMF